MGPFVRTGPTTPLREWLETPIVTADTLVLLYLIIVYGGIAVLSARAVVRQKLVGRGRSQPVDRPHRR
jgi:hypothetical protein